MARKKIIIAKNTVSSNQEVSKKNFVFRFFGHIIRHLKNRHERHYRDNYFHFWADLFLLGTLIGSLAIAAILFFWQPTPNFLFTIKTTSTEIKSNAIEKFVIDYKNQEAGPVDNVSFKLDLPHYFVLKEIEQNGLYNDKDKTFTLGSLKAGAGGHINISGLIRGPINDHQIISAHLTYDFNGFTKDYLLGFDYILKNSALNLTVNIPDKIYDNTKTPAYLELTNNSSEVLDNIFISPDLGVWDISSEDHSFVDDSFKIEHLNPAEKRGFNFLVTNKQGLGESSFSVKVNQSLEDNLLEQNNFNQKIVISRPNLDISFKPKVNNFSLPTRLEGDLVIKNQEKSEIKNISLAIGSSNGRISFNDFSSTDTSVSKSGVIVIATLAPGEEKIISFNFNISRKETVVNESFYPLITSTYVFNDEHFTYTAAASLLKINTNITLHSAAYYYSLQGDQLGIGPLPPQVDIPTTYWVTWEINNLGNDVPDFTMSAKLPNNIVWGEQEVVGSGDLLYEPTTRVVSWKVKDISRSGGNYRANFAITLLPVTEDIGSSPTLLENQSFIAKDGFTGDNLSKILANITTNLTEDPLAKDKDKVIPQE